jgi:hypothetical protein
MFGVQSKQLPRQEELQNMSAIILELCFLFERFGLQIVQRRFRDQ